MNPREQRFVETVWKYYQQHGRHNLPWRKTRDTYRILVSEMMLQQTQVERVVTKYQEFLKEFPSARRLAAAPLGDVLRAWQGLGYNRRAKFLWQTAGKITSELKGKWPHDEPGLRSLPGVGPYTAGALIAFSYNTPVVMIETNIRQVYLHHFFSNVEGISDKEILNIVERTLSQDNVREWYYALMDYGTYLKQIHGNINHKSKHYTKQSKFHGSDRHIRGAIIKVLTRDNEPLTETQLLERLVEVEPYLKEESGRVASQLAHLTKEGLVTLSKTKYQLA